MTQPPFLWLLLCVWVSSSVSWEDTVLGGRAPLIQEDLLSDPSRGFSSVSGSPLLSRRRSLSLEGGAPHPGGPPLRPFPWLLLCVFSVMGILVSRLRVLLHPGGPGPWHTALKPQQVLHPFEHSIFSFPKKPRLTRLC